MLTSWGKVLGLMGSWLFCFKDRTWEWPHSNNRSSEAILHLLVFAAPTLVQTYEVWVAKLLSLVGLKDAAHSLCGQTEGWGGRASESLCFPRRHGGEQITGSG